MKPGTAIDFDPRPIESLAPAFPQTVTIGLMVGGYVLPLHYWIPSPEAAEMMAAGRWR